MPHRPRSRLPRSTFHVVNRATLVNCSSGTSVSISSSFVSWRGCLDESPVDLFAFCLMPNHWHLPGAGRDASRSSPDFMYRLSMTHALALASVARERRNAAPFIKVATEPRVVHEDSLFLSRGALRGAQSRAGQLVGARRRLDVVERVAESARSRASELAEWPAGPRPPNWSAFVNEVEPQPELAFMRLRARRARAARRPDGRGRQTPAIQLVDRPLQISDED